MAKKIIWTKKAKTELMNVMEYWTHRNKSKTFSIKLNKLVEVQLNLIAEYPKITRETDIPNVHVKVIQKYLLFYEIIDENLYVLAFRHSSRNPETLKIK